MTCSQMISRYVDFGAIPPHQLDMHVRLQNWGRACNGRAGDSTAPMFRLFRGSQTMTPSYGLGTAVPVDRIDAARIGRGVYGLPEPHRIAVQWAYVQRTSVMRGRKLLACTAEALAIYVMHGRQMLLNRGV